MLAVNIHCYQCFLSDRMPVKSVPLTSKKTKLTQVQLVSGCWSGADGSCVLHVAYHTHF